MKRKIKRQFSAVQSPIRWTREAQATRPPRFPTRRDRPEQGEASPKHSRIEPPNPRHSSADKSSDAETASPSPAGAGEGRGEGARASRSGEVHGEEVPINPPIHQSINPPPRSTLGLEKYFLPYQSDFIRDPASLVIVEKGRQIGLSYAAAYKAVRLVATHTAKLDVWVASRDEVQARQFLLQCKRWAKTLNYAARAHQQKLLLAGGKSVQLQVLKFANGLCIYCLSSSPDAIVGKSGHVILDEFALHKDQRQLYAVAKPVTQWGGTLSIISTHRGVGTVFNELVTDARRHGNKMGWSLHTIPVQKAVEEGLVEKIDAATAGQWTERFKSSPHRSAEHPLGSLQAAQPDASSPSPPSDGGEGRGEEVPNEPEHRSAGLRPGSSSANHSYAETVSPSPAGAGEGRGEGARASRTLREFWLQQQRAECIDEEQWLQEYCCTPADESAAFITYEMIAACEDDSAPRDFACLSTLSPQ